MKHLLNFLWLLLYCCSCSIVAAQNPHPSFINYTSDDGLPSSEVHCAFQDKDGYMWFGTDNGLSRFDGYEFINYSAAEGLSDPVVFDILEDSQHRLWILTLSGQVFILEDEILKAFEGNAQILQNQKLYYISKGFQMSDDEQELFISLKHFGILKFNLENFKASYIKPHRISHFILDSAEIRLTSSYMPSGHQDSIPSSMMAPFVLIKSDKQVILERDKRSTASGFGSLIGIGEDEYLTQNSGELFFIKNEKLSFRRPIQNYFTCIEKINGRLWLGQNDYKGILVVNSMNDLKKHESNQIILPGVFVSSIFEDSQKGLWITSIEDGVFYCAHSSVVTYNEASGLDEDFVKSISIKSDKHIYVANWQGPVHELNHFSGEIVTSLTNPYYESYNYDINYNKAFKKLLVGPRSIIYSSGIPYLITPHHSEKFVNSLGMNKIGSRTFQNKIMFCTHSRVSEFNFESNSIISDLNLAGLNSVRILDANYDNEGNRWISRIDGLYLWENDKFIRPNKLDSLLYYRVEAIEFLSDGQIVLGTKGNGVIIGYQKGRTNTITTHDGLTANNIENIHIDSLDQIWVGTLNGLNRITLTAEGPKIKVFTKKHGLPSNEITKVRTQPGITWVATNKGLCKLVNTEIDTITAAPILNDISINNQKVSVDSTTIFSHDENSLKINYLALDYKAQGDILYRYRIDSLSEWQTTKQTELNLSRLGPGTYNFEIQAQNEDRYWSPSLSIPIKIKKPWWLQTWFLILALLSFITLVYLYYQNRVNNLINRNKVQKQLLELERSALQSQMNPHFIFNVLNSIQAAISTRDSEKANALLSKFAKLIRATLNNARSEMISLDEEIRYLDSYLTLEKIRHHDKFEYNIEVHNELDIFDITIPPMLIQPFVENAINHGLPTDKLGQITIIIQGLKEYIKVIIQDNGLGLRFSAKNPKDHESLAMKITERRLNLFNQKDLDNNITIKEIKNSAGEISGTQFSFKVKTT